MYIIAEAYTYIILFQDGTLQFFNKLQEKRDFQEGTKQFKTPDTLPIYEVVEWTARAWQGHRHIKEIELK